MTRTTGPEGAATAILDALRGRRPGPRLVAIVGIPGPGKSTVAAAVASRVPGAAVVPMDGYHRPRSDLNADGLARRGAPDTFDPDSLRSDLLRLRENGGGGAFPAFDHAMKDPQPGAVVVPAGAPLVIVEGLYLLLRSWRMADLFDFSAFLDGDVETALERVAARHLACGLAATTADARHRADTNDRRNALTILDDGCRERAVKWLLPREEHFFVLLERGAARAQEISALLVDCCAAGPHADREAIVERMHGVEHEADRVIAEVYGALNRTFVTPLDRSDIYSLAVSLEEVADAVFATALQFVVHAMEDLPGGSRELAALILQSCETIRAAVADLRGMRNAAGIRERCELLDRLESEGDRIYRTQLAAMFRAETDAVRLIEHKEFLEGLERTLDACEDVGGALRTVVIKNA